MENIGQISNQPSMPAQAMKTSRCAIASLVFSLVGFVVPLISSILGLVFGIAGLIHISKGGGQIKGRGMAIAGIAVSCVSFVWSALVALFLVGFLLRAIFAPTFEKTGGYKIRYEMASSQQSDSEVLYETCDIIRKRLDPIRVFGVTVNPAENNRIEICVPVCDTSRNQLSNPEDLKRMLKGSGLLEFRILPGTGELNASVYVEALATQGPGAASDVRYIWCEVQDAAGWHSINNITGKYEDKMYVLASNQDNEKMTHSEKAWKLKKAYSTPDMEGQPAIGFTLDAAGANQFYQLTRDNIDRPLCILLDNIAISAPNINTAISFYGIITGKYSRAEVEEMVNILNAGVLPAAIRPIENSVAWTKGK
jgi:preprotein translocase subunit SecD